MPHPFWKKGGLYFSSDAEKSETTLRKRRSAFHYFQLLRKKGAPGDRSGAESFCESNGRSEGTIRVLASGLCVDAGACAFVGERTEERNAFQDSAGVEAESVAGDAREEKARFTGTVGAKVSERTWRVEAILAKEILRLQRLEREEAEREIRVHARESGEAETGGASEGLAMEQLVVLCAGKIWIGED